MFAPGEAFQFDWSEDWAYVGGERIKLSHSRAFLVRAYLLQTHEMLFDAHWHAFRVFEGVPSRISNTLEADFCVEALSEAVHRFGPPEIMNTDQGSQFTSFVWTDRLKRIGTRISMDGKGRCLDNIFIERLWRSLKYECVYLHAWETGSQAKAGVGRWINFYNHQRPHTAHGGQPPAVVYFNQIEADQQGQRVA